jgi:ABC-type sugar transport system ATPase subunit
VTPTPGEPPVRLVTQGLTVRFGGLEALGGVDVTVAAGETVGVIGPNGSGKTTLFNAISGLYQPAAGEIRLEGRPLAGLEPHLIARLGVARTFQASRLCLGLSVFDNVLIGMHARRRTGLVDAVGKCARVLPKRPGSSPCSAPGSWTAASTGSPSCPRSTAAASRSAGRWRCNRGSSCSTSPPPG